MHVTRFGRRSRVSRAAAVALLAAAACGLAAGGALAGGGGGGGRSGGNDGEERRQEAVKLCGDYARRLVREDGGRDADVEEVRQVEGREGRFYVEADVRGRYDGEDTEGRITCEVENGEVEEFDEDGLRQG